jgi:hypothetical protein
VDFGDRYNGDPRELVDVPLVGGVGYRVQWFEYVDGEPPPNDMTNEPLIIKHPEKQAWSSQRSVVSGKSTAAGEHRWYPYPSLESQSTWEKDSIWELAADMALKNNVSNVWAEFGVQNGISARYFLKRLPSDGLMYLFDSFEGIPEDWGPHKAGHFAAEKIPKFYDPRVFIKKGWFKDMLPLDDLLGFVHIDSDLYSSARDALGGINVTSGSIVLFDELWGYTGWEDHEYKALMEWDRDWRFIARDGNQSALVEVL